MSKNIAKINKAHSYLRSSPYNDDAPSHLSHYMGRQQREALIDALRGEEGEVFADMVIALRDRLISVPRTYGQDGLGRSAIVHLHYFIGGSDFYITELDESAAEDGGHHQAFGFACVNGESDLGYISIPEILSVGVELDLYWTPKTMSEVLGKA